MPLFLLSYKADLDNLTDLQPRGGCDDPNYSYFLKLKCEGCGEITQKETCVMLSETVDLPNSRGTAHLLQRGHGGSALDAFLSLTYAFHGLEDELFMPENLILIYL